MAGNMSYGWEHFPLLGTCNICWEHVILLGTCKIFWEHVIFAGNMSYLLVFYIIFAGNMYHICREHVSYLMGWPGLFFVPRNFHF
ncbi:hypothetical protein M6B38_383655 [Iris pallida]|uniref:Uncharacterized protein n=1 Tax=Iris pallida TaxID=29817 RepID=A0AAX6G4Q2_IRIPA|nr:hypothetical protein M6B38_383655 [Iris pallida]